MLCFDILQEEFNQRIQERTKQHLACSSYKTICGFQSNRLLRQLHNSDYLFIESFYFHGNTEIILIFNYTRVYSSIDFNSVVASTEARALLISTLKNIKEEEWV